MRFDPFSGIISEKCAASAAERGTPMEQQKLDRISELARKSRTAEGLTDAERAEQMALRQEYIESMKRSLRAQLDNIEIIDENGSRPLKRKS